MTDWQYGVDLGPAYDARSGQEELPGPESDAETWNPLPKVIPFGQDREPGRSRLTDAYEPLPPVWRSPDGHDEWCESDWVAEVGMYTPCGCAARVSTGCYPDGQRESE
jgi:hypothetical protein